MTEIIVRKIEAPHTFYMGDHQERARARHVVVDNDDPFIWAKLAGLMRENPRQSFFLAFQNGNYRQVNFALGGASTRDNLILRGSGRHTVMQAANIDYPIFKLDGAAADHVTGFELRDMTLDMSLVTGAKTAADAFEGTYLDDPLIEGIVLTSPRAFGIHLSHLTNGCRVRDIYGTGNDNLYALVGLGGYMGGFINMERINVSGGAWQTGGAVRIMIPTGTTIAAYTHFTMRGINVHDIEGPGIEVDSDAGIASPDTATLHMEDIVVQDYGGNFSQSFSIWVLGDAWANVLKKGVNWHASNPKALGEIGLAHGRWELTNISNRDPGGDGLAFSSAAATTYQYDVIINGLDAYQCGGLGLMLANVGRIHAQGLNLIRCTGAIGLTNVTHARFEGHAWRTGILAASNHAVQISTKGATGVSSDIDLALDFYDSRTLLSEVKEYIEDAGGAISKVNLHNIDITTTGDSGAGAGKFALLSTAPTTDLVAVSPQFDLSGSASDLPFFTARVATMLRWVDVVYDEASSADAGVVIRLGKASDTDFHWTGTSEINKALGYIKALNHADLLKYIIQPGESLYGGTAGAKVGTGVVRYVAHLVPLGQGTALPAV